jgi:rubrerythrin
MVCPKCGYVYYLELIDIPEYEVCPLGCGYRGKFKTFLIG